MNALRLLDLDGFENLYIGHVIYGMWTPQEFREKHNARYRAAKSQVRPEMVDRVFRGHVDRVLDDDRAADLDVLASVKGGDDGNN